MHTELLYSSVKFLDKEIEGKAALGGTAKFHIR